ncbi:MAG: PKD domain-containing protein, partial [Omnitrophica WOR_2 bacterium]
MRTYIAAVLFIITILASAQKEANNWYFGNKAGISFESGSPSFLLDGALIYSHGTSTISDSAGNLLFYTDGEHVYNRIHQQMPNGYGLLGNSLSQTSLIMRKPESYNEYYIFTVGNGTIYPLIGLHYSLVKMNLDGGLGDIYLKNVPLAHSNNAVEKITAICNSVNSGFWVIVRNLTQPVNEFHSYLVTSNGISTIPVKTNCLSNILIEGSGNNMGQMKISPDGKFIVSPTGPGDPSTEIGVFNNQTGKIMNSFSLVFPLGHYGVEFSSDSHFIYFTSYSLDEQNRLLQYDLSLLPDQEAFENSLIDIGELGNGLDLQIGLDGRIYVARNYNDYLGVINNPSLKGVACDYDSLGVYLGGRKCYRGLPQFIQTYFLRFEYNGQCAGDTYTFTPNFNPVPDSIHWDFGDPASGANNYSNELNPQHLYQTGGLYNVTAFVRYPDGRTETANRDVTVAQLPLPYPGNDTLFCKGSSIILQAQSGYDSYLWSTNE